MFKVVHYCVVYIRLNKSELEIPKMFDGVLSIHRARLHRVAKSCLVMPNIVNILRL